jgi:hypothetical protein
MQRGDLRVRGNGDRRSRLRRRRAPRPATGGLPAAFLGVWERSELSVDGRPVADPGRAVWLETGSGFVDLRTGEGPDCPAAGGGTTTLDGATLVWSLDADSRAEQGLYRAVERGQVGFDGTDLVEEGSGTDGSPAAYRARWRRLPGVGGPWAPNLAAVTARGVAVRIGMHAAAVVDRGPAGGGIAAAYCRWDGFVWRAALTFGDDPDDLPMLEPGAVLPAGWTWRPAASPP